MNGGSPALRIRTQSGASDIPTIFSAMTAEERRNDSAGGFYTTIRATIGFETPGTELTRGSGKVCASIVGRCDSLLRAGLTLH